MTVIIVVGNGNDTSGVNYCKRSDNVMVPCEDEGHSLCVPTTADPIRGTGSSTTCGSQASSLSYYQSYFKSLKSNLKFYAAVANQNSTQCLGGTSRIGYRYQQMAAALDGASYDVCTTSINQVVTNIASGLKIIRLAYKQHYLFVSQEPNPSTIQVTRYAGGDANQASVIPNDATNGWTYAGLVHDVSVLSTTTPAGLEVHMNNASGYAIQLNGTAQLSGTDTSSVEYKPVGATSSVSE